MLCKFLVKASLLNSSIPDKPSTPSQTIGEKKTKTFPKVRTIFFAFVLLKKIDKNLFALVTPFGWFSTQQESFSLPSQWNLLAEFPMCVAQLQK